MSTESLWNLPNGGTVILIIISVFIGAFGTHIVKYFFETHIPSWRLKKETRVSIQKYQLPLLQYGYAAKNSILTILKNPENKSNDDSYLRALYYICAFLGWCQVLSKKSLIEFVENGLITSAAIETFGNHYNNMVRGISSLDYFLGLEETFGGSIDAARIPSLAVTAIGDSMAKNDEKVEGIYPEIIGFKDFVHSYKNNPESKEWFAYVENILHYETKSKSDIKWNRLIIFYTHIEVFISYLENRNKNTLQKVVGYFHELRRTPKPYVVIDRITKEVQPTVKGRLQTELTALGYPFTYGKI